MGLHKLIPMMLLVAGVYCAPGTYGVGGKVGYNNVIDGEIGAEGKIVRDGLSLDFKGSTNKGASWKPMLYGGAYAQADKKMYVADGSLGGYVGNYVSTRGHFAGGLDSEGKIPLAFQPGVSVQNAAFFDPRGALHTGDEAWQRAALYGGPAQPLPMPTN